MATRVTATVRDPIAEKIKRLREKEDRSESSMVAALLEEAIAAREAKDKTK